MPKIPIPTDADINLRNALENIEERLSALEGKDDDANANEIQALKEAIGKINEGSPEDLEVNGDLWVANDVIADGTISMPHLYEGLIQVVPSGEAGTSTAQRVINMHASLAIAPGGLSAESVRARNVWFTRPSAAIWRGTDQTISNTTWTVLWFGATQFNNGDMLDTSDPTKFTISEPGVYCYGASGRYDNNATGYRYLGITLNDAEGDGGWLVRDTVIPDANIWPHMMCSDLRLLNSGDIIRASTYQSSGGDLNIDSAVPPRFWCFKVSD